MIFSPEPLEDGSEQPCASPDCTPWRTSWGTGHTCTSWPDGGPADGEHTGWHCWT
jgi:hypothetical protein